MRALPFMQQPFIGNQPDGSRLGDPRRIYSSGASEVYKPGIDHKSILNWCVPPYYQEGYLGAPSVAVTVRVKLEDPDDDTHFVDLSGVFATITWGSGVEGGPDAQVMDFDVVHGGSVSVEAWSLNVEITYPDPTKTGLPTPEHPIIRVDVSVGIGTTGKASVSSSATRTVSIGDLAIGGSSADLQIPMYAVGARIVNTDPTVPTLEINQLQAAGGQLVSVERVGKLQRDAVPIARGRGARWFSVTNFNAVISHDTAVIFDLSPN